MRKLVPAGAEKRKEVLRRELLLRRARQKEKDLLGKSNRIEKRLFSLAAFREAKCVMFYVSMNEEVRTRGMIRRSLEMGKRVVVPSLKPDRKRITPSLLVDYESDLEEGVFGIPEPRAECMRSLPVEDIEIVLVPGVAFDVCGGRLGFGGGYYDEFLARLSSGTERWGLAFEFQVVEKLPLTDRDVSVEKVITEERVIDCNGRSLNALA